MTDVYKGNPRLYPRGFVGPRLANVMDFTEDRDVTTTVMTQAVVGTETTKIAGRYLAHPRVETIYKALNTDPTLLNKFEVREELLRIGKQMLIDSPVTWMRLQLRSPVFTSNHLLLLKNTLEYIESGQSRISMHTWDSFLTGDTENITNPNKPTLEEVNELCRVHQSYLRDSNTFILGIVTKPSGWTYYTGLLHLLFGDVPKPEMGVSSQLNLLLT